MTADPSTAPVPCATPKQASDTSVSAAIQRVDAVPRPNEHLMTSLAGPLGEAGFELVDMELLGGAGGRVVRVLVDRIHHRIDGRIDGRIDMDGVAAATGIVSGILDMIDPIPEAYTLEVSSPGLQRPLRTADHFARFVGSTVKLKLRAGVAPERRIEGILHRADAHSVTVGDLTVALESVESAHTVFVWGPPPKPGHGPKHQKPDERNPRRSVADPRGNVPVGDLSESLSEVR